MNQDNIHLQELNQTTKMDSQNRDSKAQVDTFEDAELHRSKSNKDTAIFENDLDYAGATQKTDPIEIALVKKLDYRIMPTLWAMYFLNYLDRNAIASARLNDLEKDLGLVGTQYNTCISILFVGYLLMQVPSNMIMNSGKIRPSLYMGLCMVNPLSHYIFWLSDNKSGTLGYRFVSNCTGQELHWTYFGTLLPRSY